MRTRVSLPNVTILDVKSTQASLNFSFSMCRTLVGGLRGSIVEIMEALIDYL